MWKFSKDGDFSMASAYALTGPVDTNGQAVTASLSGKSLLQEVFSAMWLAPSVRSTKNLFYTSQGTAPLQGIFGGRLEPPQAMAKFLQLDLSEWLKTNCLAKDFISANGIPWRYLFPFAIWTLWKHRN
nr:hypothetical protein CFP56_47464 [Quercus suber]